MTNSDVHSAFNALYSFAREVLLNGRDSDTREKAGQIMRTVVLEHYPEESNATGEEEK